MNDKSQMINKKALRTNLWSNSARVTVSFICIFIKVLILKAIIKFEFKTAEGTGCIYSRWITSYSVCASAEFSESSRWAVVKSSFSFSSLKWARELFLFWKQLNELLRQAIHKGSLFVILVFFCLTTILTSLI